MCLHDRQCILHLRPSPVADAWGVSEPVSVEECIVQKWGSKAMNLDNALFNGYRFTHAPGIGNGRRPQMQNALPVVQAHSFSTMFTGRLAETKTIQSRAS